MIRIIGFGNPYHGDDGFGIEVVHRLQGDVPSGVDVCDGGTLGLDALALFENCDEVIIVDAARGGIPGEVQWITGDSVKNGEASINLSTHGFGVAKLLKIVDMELSPTKRPNIRFLAGWIDDIKVFHEGLSERAETSVQEAVRMIREDRVWQSC